MVSTALFWLGIPLNIVLLMKYPPHVAAFAHGS